MYNVSPPCLYKNSSTWLSSSPTSAHNVTNNNPQHSCFIKTANPPYILKSTKSLKDSTWETKMLPAISKLSSISISMQYVSVETIYSNPSPKNYNINNSKLPIHSDSQSFTCLIKVINGSIILDRKKRTSLFIVLLVSPDLPLSSLHISWNRKNSLI